MVSTKRARRLRRHGGMLSFRTGASQEGETGVDAPDGLRGYCGGTAAIVQRFAGM